MFPFGQIVAEYCSMQDGLPQQPTLGIWSTQAALIENLAKAALERLSGSEGVSLHLEDVKDGLKKRFSASPEPSSFVDIPAIIDIDVRQFVEAKRQRLWDDHKQLVMSFIQEYPLLPSMQKFKDYYSDDRLLKRVFAEYRLARSENQPADRFCKWIMDYTRQVLDTEFTDDSGQLRDEELVRLYRMGYKDCRTTLIERCAAKLRKITVPITWEITPDAEDPTEFSRDVFQEVLIKLLKDLDTFDFRSSFDTWLKTNRSK